MWIFSLTLVFWTLILSADVIREGQREIVYPKILPKTAPQLTGKGPSLPGAHDYSLGLTTAAFSANGKYLLAGFGHPQWWKNTNSLGLWEVKSGKLVQILRGHEASVRFCAFLPDERHAVSVAWEGTLKIWDLTKAKEIRSVKVADGVACAAISPDARYLALAVGAGKISILHIPEATVRKVLGFGAPISSLVFSPDSQILISAGPRTDVQKAEIGVWSLRHGTRLTTLEFTEGESAGDWWPDGAVSPDGKLAVFPMTTNNLGATLQLWEVKTGKVIRAFRGYGWGPVAFSPNGKHVFSQGSGSTYKVWDVDTGDEVNSVWGEKAVQPRCMAYSQDRTLIFTCSGIDQVGRGRMWPKIWDTDQGKLLCDLENVTEFYGSPLPKGRKRR